MAKVYLLSKASSCAEIQTDARLFMNGKEAMNALWESAGNDIKNFIQTIMRYNEAASLPEKQIDPDRIDVKIDSKGYFLRLADSGDFNSDELGKLFCKGELKPVSLDAGSEQSAANDTEA